MNDMYADLKVLPFNKEAEEAVVGGILVDPSAYDRIEDQITPADFHVPNNRTILEAFLNLKNKGRSTDVISIAEYIKDTVEFAYIANLAANTPSIANIHGYASVVRDTSLKRQLIGHAQVIADQGFNSTDSAETLVSEAQATLLSMEAFQGEEAAQANLAIKNVIDDIDFRFNNKGAEIGLYTGFADIDQKVAGFRDGDLIILAARPAMGKTTLAMNIAENVVRKNGGIMVFSLEMTKEQLIERMIASSGGISASRIRRGTLEEDDWPKLSSAVSLLKDTPLYIDDRGGLSIEQIKSSARKTHKRQGLKAIIVDYLQLVSSKAQSREQEISKISRELKALAKELNIPVIALSQLNRKCEDRTNKRPNNSDLRDSGAIEQDADVIMFLYRDEVYYENTEHKGIAELIFSKTRGFETGTVYLASRLDINKFDNLSREVPAVEDKSDKRFDY